MDMMTNRGRDGVERDEGQPAISTDRELLKVLGLSDALAANYLGKSRQALHLKLGSRDSGNVHTPYFKIAEIVVLVLAARQRGRNFHAGAVWDFVDWTKDDRPGGVTESLTILEKLLRGEGDVEIDDAGTVVMILPGFADQPAALPAPSRDLQRMAGRLAAMRPVPWIAILSSTTMQARMAVEWLGLPEKRTRAFRHDDVDYCVPSILVFPRDGGDPRPYLLTEVGGITSAPQFRANMMAGSARYMIPAEARAELFTYDDAEVEEEEEGGAEVKPRKRA